MSPVHADVAQNAENPEGIRNLSTPRPWDLPSPDDGEVNEHAAIDEFMKLIDDDVGD